MGLSYRQDIDMTADEVKAFVLCYLRFKRGFSVVATEYNYGASDIIGIDKARCYIWDIEVKVSLADMKRERTKHKHSLFRHNDARVNFFSFAVPFTIEEKALDLCRESFPYAGLIVVDDIEAYLFNHSRPYGNIQPVRVARKPMQKFQISLHFTSVEQMYRDIAVGACNSLCSKAYELVRMKRI